MIESGRERIDKMILGAEEANRIRKKYVDALRYGKIPFHEFVTLLDDPELDKRLGKLKIFAILATFSGWNRVTARHALISNGLPVELSLRQVRSNDNYMAVCTMLMNASASTWQQRVKAPPGWPWFGNVLDALNELDAEAIPLDIREYRYQVDGWVEGGETPEQVETRWAVARESWESAPRKEDGTWSNERAGIPMDVDWEAGREAAQALSQGDIQSDTQDGEIEAILSEDDGLDAVFADDGESVPIEDEGDEFDINSYLGED